jgi:hypothetical protein
MKKHVLVTLLLPGYSRMLMERSCCYSGFAWVSSVSDAPPKLGQHREKLVLDEDERVSALEYNLE